MPPKSELKTRAREILRRLKKAYPKAHTALQYKTPFELLVATILSAQSTDVQVNKTTPALFAKYQTIKTFALCPLDELQKDVSSINFYRNKARHIQASAQKVMSEFGGQVPRSMAELITLPGVARKTANIVLSEAFGLQEGIAVDTHVKRLTKLLGLTLHDDPVKVEQDLMELVQRKNWSDMSNLLILHGRAVCNARKPLHAQCILADICPSNK